MRYIIIVSLLFGGIAHAQNFEDDFSDQDISNWAGDINDFIFEEENENILLRLHASEPGKSMLSISSIHVVGYWEFFIRMDGFGPSGSNKAEFFLMSDSLDLFKKINGYKLSVGESGSDDVFRLFRVTDGEEETEVLTGTTVAGSGGDYRVKVTRDETGKWTLEVAESYAGILSIDATGTDNTYSNADYFGVILTYTSTRSDLFYLDFKIDLPPVTIEPLYIDKFSVISNTELDFTFNRDIDFNSVQTNDFQLGDGISPASYTTQAGNELRINFTNPILEGQNELLVSGIESSKNDTVLSDTTLNFTVFNEYQTGDVIINEFLKDPPPDSELSEYVELKNTTSKYLNLKDWQIGDSNSLTIITDEDLAILPDSFLVVTTDPDALTLEFGPGHYVECSLPALNNTTDQIRVLSANHVIADSLEYTPDWGGNDIAIERISENLGSILRVNWGDSPEEIGTPGWTNSIPTDTTPPKMISSTFKSSDSLLLIFNERLSKSRATDFENYNISGGHEIKNVYSTTDSVVLTISEELLDGEQVILTIRNQQDVFGNSMTDTTITLTYVELSIPDEGHVVINEILYRRADELSPEFVELFNNSDKNFDLSGWKVLDAAGNDDKFPLGTILYGGGYLVLSDRRDFAESVENAVYLSSFPLLNNAGDGVIIKNEKEVTIDSLYYEDNWGGDKPGHSLERKDPGRASNDPENWSTSLKAGGSAGVQSSVFEEDNFPPEIIFATQYDNLVEIIFSEFIRMTEETRFFVNGEISDVYEFNSEKANGIILEWNSTAIPSAEKVSAQNSELSISNLTDIKGNSSESLSAPLSVPVESGAIVINEILYDPLADSDDNLPDQSEYVELYNRSDVAVSLEGIFLHDAPDEDGEIRAVEAVTSKYKWIPSHGYFLIYADDESANFNESKLADYFELTEESDQFTIRVDRTSLSLSSSEDAIFLSDSTGNTIDSVFYSQSWQNPNVFDTDGVALERINPDGRSNDASNWSSSTEVNGGTPGEQNSIFQEEGVTPEGVGITFTTNPFSPDGDGFEDNLFINYNLDHADYLLRVRIFDRYGREVRELANNYQAGFSGSLIWDGLTDDRRKNRVGIYIIVFEAYDSSFGIDQSFKETVVLARKF